LKTRVRLIAATNRKLDDEVHAGRFRRPVVPPERVSHHRAAARQRPEDIPLL